MYLSDYHKVVCEDSCFAKKVQYLSSLLADIKGLSPRPQSCGPPWSSYEIQTNRASDAGSTSWMKFCEQEVDVNFFLDFCILFELKKEQQQNHYPRSQFYSRLFACILVFFIVMHCFGLLFLALKMDLLSTLVFLEEKLLFKLSIAKVMKYKILYRARSIA